MILRVSLVLAFLYSFLSACGGGFWPENYEFNFLHKRDFLFSNIDGNLNYSSTYNQILRDSSKKVKEKNLEEWQKEFGNKYSIKQIKEFLYEKKNLDQIKDQDIKEYIKLVIEQEPYVSNDREYYLKYGYRGKKLNKLRVDTMISDALAKVATIKSNYLKTRYFFLALRLAHYYNKANALKIYEDNKSLLKNSKSIVKDWIQALYAGLLLKEGKKVKSVYEFSKLFEKGKDNWYLAFYNFNINTDKEWNDLISMAKNKEEKIKFFTLRSLNESANIIEELKNIAKIDKNSKYFDLVLFRKLLSSQSFFNIYPQELRYYDESHEEFAPYISYLKTVSKDDMYTVNLALAYFSFYQDDIKSSKEYLQKAYKTVKGDDIDELNALDYIIYLNGIKTIDKKVENVIGKKLEKLSLQKCNGKAIYRYTFNTIKYIYKENGDDFKYFISASYRYLSTNDINLDKYNKIQALRNKKDKTVLEKYMFKNIISRDTYFEKSLQRAHFKILMNSLEFEKALKEVPSDDYKLRLNIFNNLIKGNNRRFVKNKLTYKQTLQKIIQIKENLKKNPNAPMDNYLYATVLYNLSYWGNLNDLTTVYRNNYAFKEKELELKKLKLSNKHLKIALKNTKDKEFKAKITYMLAKNELALYDIKSSKKRTYNGVDEYNFNRLYRWGYSFGDIEDYMISGYGKYFDKLKKDYSNTNYYKELIEECANLRNYQYTLKEVNGPKIEPTWSSQKLLVNLEAGFKYIYQSKNRLAKKYDKIFFWKLLKQVPITKKTVTRYNNIAYYLQKMSSFQSNHYAKMILEKVIEKFPNRIVAYYNLGDIYWGDYNKGKAKELYKKYIELMKKAGKEKRIPQKVKDRVGK